MNIYSMLLCGIIAAMPFAVRASGAIDTTSVASGTTIEKWDAIISRLPKISGYLQTGWDYNSLGDGTSTFQVKRLRLLMDGVINSKASFRLQIEAFSGTPSHPNGQKSFQVMDAYATYRFSPAIQVRAGQYNSPMCYENYNLSPATMETIDFSSLCSRMLFRNAIGYDHSDFGRDLGIMVMGELFPSGDGSCFISYNLSLVNGHLPSINDSNKSKEVQTVLFYRPIKYFNAKFAYSYGEYDGLKEGDGYRNQPMTRVIGGVLYDNPTGIDIRAEYGYSTAKHKGFHVVKENSFYVLAAYHLGRFLPVVRYEFYRDGTDRSLITGNCDKYLLGVSYVPCRNIKFQANYTLTRYTADAKRSNDGCPNSSLIQLMGMFQF